MATAITKLFSRILVSDLLLGVCTLVTYLVTVLLMGPCVIPGRRLSPGYSVEWQPMPFQDTQTITGQSLSSESNVSHGVCWC